MPDMPVARLKQISDPLSQHASQFASEGCELGRPVGARPTKEVHGYPSGSVETCP
jgi:hypothetical protein